MTTSKIQISVNKRVWDALIELQTALEQAIQPKITYHPTPDNVKGGIQIGVNKRVWDALVELRQAALDSSCFDISKQIADGGHWITMGDFSIFHDQRTWQEKVSDWLGLK